METQKISVGLVQVNNEFSNQFYFPYSVGVLQAHACAHLENANDYTFLTPIFRREPVEQAVQKLIGANIVGFSLYVWNAQISLYIAEELKKQSPETLIVFGGPHVPNHLRPAPPQDVAVLKKGGQAHEAEITDRVGFFLRTHPFVDIAVHGEGEQIFSALLMQLPGGDFSKVPGISYLKDGVMVTTAPPPRMRDLSMTPSPYLTGVFDSLLAAHPTYKWIAIWETNRGCPFSCTFCDWGSAVAQKVYTHEMDRLFREVEWFAKRKIEYVFTADANFGFFERDVDLARHCATTKASTGFPVRLSVQSTKSGRLESKLTERAFHVQKILSDSGLNQGVVVSMQSIDDKTLEAIKRSNISTDVFREIQNRFTAAGVETMTDLILGLPGETYDSFTDGVSELIHGGQHNRIQFNNLSILPNAEMGDPEYQKKYGMEMVRSRIINIHGYRDESEKDIDEYQELVVSTSSTSREDWVRTRVFAWASAFLHFDKVLQMPLMVTHELAGVSYRKIIEAFLDKAILQGSYPILEKVRFFFEAKARDIQLGGEEYCYSKEWLGIWWPADEYALIELVAGGSLSDFYREAERLLLASFAVTGSADYSAILQDAVRINQALMKIPFADGDIQVQTSWDVLEFRRRVMCGESKNLSSGSFVYAIDRTSERWTSLDEWCRHVVWYGNKRGAYLYGNAPVVQLSGHF